MKQISNSKRNSIHKMQPISQEKIYFYKRSTKENKTIRVIYHVTIKTVAQ